MKFAVLALLGFVQAAQVVIPDIEWDAAKVQTASNDASAWAA